MAVGEARPRPARIWAALIAVYALIMHVPAMAALGEFPASPAVVLTLPDAQHHHGEDDGSSKSHCYSALCCSTCLTAVGFTGPAALPLLLPLRTVRVHRPRFTAQKPRRFTTSTWRTARGPPTVV